MPIRQPSSDLPKIHRPPPRIWLMTDERNDAHLEQAIERLPRASGIVFRHYHLAPGQRRCAFLKVQKLAKQNGHIVVLAGSPRLARLWGANGAHGRNWSPTKTNGLLHSAPVHSFRELIEAKRSGADLVFLSPVFATRSHPGKKPLSRLQLKRLIQNIDVPVILLGGMSAERFARVKDTGAYGWAAIDAFLTKQSN